MIFKLGTIEVKSGSQSGGISSITSDTDTDLNGILKGNGGKVGTAIPGTDFPDLNPSAKVAFPTNNILQPTDNGRVYNTKSYTGALTLTVGACNYNDFCSGIFSGNTEPTITGATKHANSDDFASGHLMEFYLWKAPSGLSYLFFDKGADTGQPTQLQAPVLSIASGGQTSLTGTITPVSNNEGYDIYESTTQNGTYTLLTTVSKNGTTFSKTGLTQGTTRWFKAVTKGNGTTTLDSDQGTAYSGTTDAVITLLAPTVSGTQTNSTTARFSWSNIANNSGYTYKVKVNSGSYGSTVDLATNTTYVDITGNQGDTIYIQILTKGNGTSYLNSGYSTEVSQQLAANSAPYADGLSITGSTGLGNTLTGHYTFHDADGDSEGTSLFQWLRDDVAISGATGLTHVIVLADQGHILKFQVTPVSTTGTTPGVSVESTGTSIPANNAPVASSVTIIGTAQVGQVITGSYSYNDTESNSQDTTSNGSEFNLKTYADAGAANADTDNSAGTSVASGYTGGNSIPQLNYTVVVGDVGKVLKLWVRPKASTGTLVGSWAGSVVSAVISTGENNLNFTTYISNMIKTGTVYQTGPADNWGDLISDETFVGDFQAIIDLTDSYAIAGRQLDFGVNISTDTTYSSHGGWEFGVFFTSSTQANFYEGSTADGSAIIAQGDRIKIKRVGSTISVEKYNSGLWTTIKTATGTFTNTMRINLRGYGDGTGRAKVYNPKYI